MYSLLLVPLALMAGVVIGDRDNAAQDPSSQGAEFKAENPHRVVNKNATGTQSAYLMRGWMSRFKRHILAGALAADKLIQKSERLTFEEAELATHHSLYLDILRSNRDTLPTAARDTLDEWLNMTPALNLSSPEGQACFLKFFGFPDDIKFSLAATSAHYSAMACEPAHAIRLVKDGDIFYRQFDMRFLSAHNDLDGVRPEDRQNFSHLIPLSLYPKTLLGAWMGMHAQNSLLINARFNQLISAYGEPKQWRILLPLQTRFAMAMKCVLSHRKTPPYEVQEVLSKWLNITKEGVVAMKEGRKFDYKQYIAK